MISLAASILINKHYPSERTYLLELVDNINSALDYAFSLYLVFSLLFSRVCAMIMFCWWWWWCLAGRWWKMRIKSAVKPIIVGLYMIRLSRILTLISNIKSDSRFYLSIYSNRKPQTTSGWVSMIGQTCERVRYICLERYKHGARKAVVERQARTAEQIEK